jgi:hypothetical protein
MDNTDRTDFTQIKISFKKTYYRWANIHISALKTKDLFSNDPNQEHFIRSHQEYHRHF